MRRIAAIALTLALGACAAPYKPVAELAAARTMVSNAQPAAARYAPQELRAAQAKLARAEAAMAAEEYEAARRLAEQAEVDAKLAWSIAESERARQAVAELNQSIDVLQKELERSPQ